MKKIHTAFIISLLLISCGKSKTNQETESTIQNTIPNTNIDTGEWQIRNYVDDFNEKTDKKYISLGPVKGVFSNSATTNSKLDVVITADTGYIEIQLFEYGGNHQAKLNGDVRFKVKESNGDIHEIKTFEGHTIHNETYTNDSLLRAILLRGGEIKFSTTFSEYGNESSYNFTIPNADHFQDAINKTLGK